MKTAGFSFIRNAVQFDYPIVEAIKSILPLCDDFYIAVGVSTDSTRQLIESIGSDRIHIIDTVWDDNLREGGRVLADETNKAFRAIGEEYTWCFYIQGDEVVHEKWLPNIRQAMLDYADDTKVEGLLFRYTHFYGSYDYIGNSRRWYRREIRIVRNNKDIYSYRDAQGFRIKDRKLRVKLIDAEVYHYGWVKSPFTQQEKQQFFNRLWHDEKWMQEHVAHVDSFDYSQIDSLAHFTGTHPEVMKERIARINWKFDFDPTKTHFSLKQRLLNFIERKTGIRLFEYRNYKII